MFCENQSVIEISSNPESLIKNKSNAIAYHVVREACPMNEIIICYVLTEDNVSNIMTNVLPSGEKRITLVE
jgi:hypothetical protein